MDYSNIRKKYTNELTHFFQDGAFPADSSADLRFGLSCQRDRIRKFGLHISKRFDNAGPEKEHAWKYADYPYTYTLNTNRCNYVAEFYDGSGKFLARSDLEEETLYLGILEKNDQGQESCTCKNCGHKDLLANFKSGCPMCGTTYEMVQSYPCVSGYYTRPTVLNKKVAKWAGKFMFLVFAFLGTFLGLVAGLSISSEQGYGIVGTIAMTLFAIILFAGGLLLFTFIFSVLMAGPLLAAKNVAQHNAVADVEGAIRTKDRMETELKRYVPDFSYEFFEEKVISLLRGIVFTDDRSRLTIYDGADPLLFMDNIVDIEYRGAVEYVGHSVIDNILRVSVKAYVVCAYYEQGNVVFRKQTFSMILAKKVKEEDLGFTIHAVNCKKCSGSFDAVHVTTCPYCGAEYSLIEDNWVVSQILLVQS